MIEGSPDPAALIASIVDVGYSARVIVDDAADMDEKERVEQAYYKQLLVKTAVGLAVGVPLMLYGMAGGEMTVSTSGERIAWFVIGLVTLAVMIVAGGHFYSSAWKSFKSHSANMDTLIALGTGTAWLYSMVVVAIPELVPELARHVYFEATAMIIGLINLGLALEVRARGKTSEAIKRLLGLRVKTARVLRDGQEVDIPIDSVQVDDLVRVKSGGQGRIFSQGPVSLHVGLAPQVGRSTGGSSDAGVCELLTGR